jgi:hypothetical protein
MTRVESPPRLQSDLIERDSGATGPKGLARIGTKTADEGKAGQSGT